jgi:glutathione S-transferase
MSGVTSALKPLTLWSHWGAPNPYKVLMVLEILHLPYVLHPLEFSEVKSLAHLALNPNGRLPTLEDPNTGIVLWEVRVLL